MECVGGDCGVPVAEVFDDVFSLAEEAGTGSHWCAGVGLVVSSGGAFIILLGIDATGGECSTSFWPFSQRGLGWRDTMFVPSLHSGPETSTRPHLLVLPASSGSD